jgi:Ser/Thr protein kinase RdoA (MazF antagonist)
VDLSIAAPALRDAYGFDEVAIGERLEGGYANDLFRVVADGRTLVLRVKLPPGNVEDVVWEHRLTRSLSQRLAEVAAPLITRGGDTFFTLGDRLAWLVPFVDGAPADPAREEHRAAAARALGRLHRAGGELSPGRRPRLRPVAELDWPAPAVPEELRDWAAAIERARAWAVAYVARVAAERRPPASLAHGDFFPGNVLLAGDAVTAVLDWEEAQVDWLTWDLANAIGTFCSTGDDYDLDPDACRAFVAAYRAGGGTAPARDDDLLVPLVRVKRILEVLRAPSDRDPRWEHQRRNLRSLERLAA